jgi:hypothetical protein
LATEDFTTYTEVDPNTHITVSSSIVSCETLCNEDAYVYDDKDAGHFTNFEHLFKMNEIATASNRHHIFWACSNDVDDFQGWLDGNDHSINITGRHDLMYLYETHSGNAYTDSYDYDIGTDYWLTVEKNGTTMTAEIYLDASRETLDDTLTLTLQEAVSFRYIFAANTRNQASTDIAHGRTEDLDLQEGGTAYTHTHTEPLQFGEPVPTYIRNLPLTVTELLQFAEAHSRVNTFLKTVTEPVQFDEQAQRVSTFLKTYTDKVQFDEQAQRVTAYTHTHTDKVQFDEQAQYIITIVKMVTELLKFDEQAQRTGAFARTVTEPVKFDEQAQRVGTFLKTVTEPLAIAEAHSYIRNLPLTVTELLQFAEHATGVTAGVALIDFPLKITSTQEELYKIDSSLEQLYKLISTQEQIYKIKKKEY